MKKHLKLKWHWNFISNSCFFVIFGQFQVNQSLWKFYKKNDFLKFSFQSSLKPNQKEPTMTHHFSQLCQWVKVIDLINQNRIFQNNLFISLTPVSSHRVVKNYNEVGGRENPMNDPDGSRDQIWKPVFLSINLWTKWLLGKLNSCRQWRCRSSTMFDKESFKPCHSF